MNTYAGESLVKKVARARTYLRAKEMLTAAGIKEDLSVVVLPGPSSAELGCLEHILKPTTVYCVDRDGRCIEDFFSKAENLEHLGWADLHGFEGELEDFHPEGPVDFANLDLMGNLNGRFDEKTEVVMSQIRMWSVVALTYLRGRETGEVRRALKGLDAKMLRGQMVRKARRRWGPDIKRSSGMFAMLQMAYHKGLLTQSAIHSGDERYLQSVSDLRDDPKMFQRVALASAHHMHQTRGLHLTPIAGYSYQANVSPMGVLLVQLIKQSEETKGWVKHLHGKTTHYVRRERRLVTSNIKKDSLDVLLVEADYLAQEGFSKKAIADIFDVSVGTMAAWKAHRTMGTYKPNRRKK